ncbi:MAG: hypothetical protein KatS3mg022_3342 [Armatimonadota bacterium]|nr:MAG: hypothetical protein KatS3mg022_3342 [Armatimonadota bacterium]
MSARRAISWLILWSVMLLASARAQSLLVDVVLGFDGVCPSEGCYPVTVLIQGERANAPPTVCELEVTATSWSGSTYARKLVTLPGGLVSQSVGFLLCTPDEPYEVTARLILRGRVLAASKPVPAIMAQWHPLLVGLGTETSALMYLPQRSLGVVSIEGKLMPLAASPQSEPPPLPPYPGSENRRLFIGRTRSSLPPENTLAYRGVAAVSLDDRAWDTLTERQQQAIIGYVLSGGLLVVHGVDINRLQSLMPSGLLPVELQGLSRVPAYALAGWIPSLGRTPTAVDVVRARPIGGAKTILVYGDTPLVVTAPKGSGQVVFLAFDPSQPPLTSNEAAHALWKNLLRLKARRFSPPCMVFPDSYRFGWSAPLTSGKDFYADFVRAMVNAVAAKPVPLNWLMTYLGVYILVLIPLNYIVLRKLDRLHLSWFTLPMLALLTSLAGYLMAAQVQVGSHQVRQWTALYTSSGSPQTLVESDWVLYSARTQRYRLQAKVDGIILENSPSDLQAQRVGEIPQEEPADLRDVPIPLWSARSFHLSGRVNLLGAVNVSAERERNTLRLMVRNNTPYTLRNFHLVTSPGIVPLGGMCSPGKQVELSVKPDAPLFIPSNPEPPYLYGGRRLHRVEAGDSESWQERAKDGWFGLVWTRVGGFAGRYFARSKPERLMRSVLPHMKVSEAVLVAEVEGFPQVVEITPLPSSAIQHSTLLAVHFHVQGGRR